METRKDQRAAITASANWTRAEMLAYQAARKQEKQVMKIKIDITVEIDVEAYKQAYGEQNLDQIRSDTKAAIIDTVNTATFNAAEGIMVSVKDNR
jgi:hypothetical protein